MADKTQNVKTRLSFDGEAEYKAACKEINSTLKVLNSEMKLVTAEYKDNRHCYYRERSTAENLEQHSRGSYQSGYVGRKYADQSQRGNEYHGNGHCYDC